MARRPVMTIACLTYFAIIFAIIGLLPLDAVPVLSVYVIWLYATAGGDFS
jgi:hypothetical protein